MLYLLTILLGSFDHSLFKSFNIFLISFFSNTFSAISGGGAGLLQLPALILSGMPYYQALASHKFATVALGIGGSLRNYKSLKNDLDKDRLGVFWALLFLSSENKIEIKQINSLYGPIQIKRIIPDGGLAQLPIENLDVNSNYPSAV